MASYHNLLQHTKSRTESPAKVFAKLKSRVQKEANEGVFADKDVPYNVNEKHGELSNSPRKTAEGTWMNHDLVESNRFNTYSKEVQAFTISPISSPQKTFSAFSSKNVDKRFVRETGHALISRHGHTPTKGSFRESTAVSYPLSSVNREQIHTDPTHVRDMDGYRVTYRTPVKIQPVQQDYLESEDEEESDPQNKVMCPGTGYSPMRKRHGEHSNSPRKTAESKWMNHDLMERNRFSPYSTEMQALTMLPVSSPQKTFSDFGSKNVDKRPVCETGRTLISRHGHTPTKGSFRESTSVSYPLSVVNKEQIQTDPTHVRDMDGYNRTPVKIQPVQQDYLESEDEKESAPQDKVMCPATGYSPMRKRLRKRKWEQEFTKVSSSTKGIRNEVTVHNNVSNVQRHCTEQLEMTCNTSEPVIPLTRSAAKKRCSVITERVPVMSPAKMFAFMKERVSQRENQEVHSTRQLLTGGKSGLSRDVPFSTHQNMDKRDNFTFKNVPECLVSVRHSSAETTDKQCSSSEDGLDPAVRKPPVFFEDPLVLNSPQISIPKKQQAVFKRKTFHCEKFPDESVVYLKQWFLRRTRKGLFVDGIHRDENIPWNSNIIADRVSSSVLKTVSGRVYIPEESSLDPPVEANSSPEPVSVQKTSSRRRGAAKEKMPSIPQKQHKRVHKKASMHLSQKHTQDTKRLSVRQRKRTVSSSPESVTSNDQTQQQQLLDGESFGKRKTRKKGLQRKRRERANPIHTSPSSSSSETSGKEEMKLRKRTKMDDVAQTQKKSNKTPPATNPLAKSMQSTKKHNVNKHNRVEEEEDEDKWTEAELMTLQQAVSHYPKHMMGYWEKVAKMVGTRSAAECHMQYTSQGSSQTPTKKPKKSQKETREAAKDQATDHPVISAGVGTFKRKQQVRQFLEAMPKEDVEDIFSSEYMQSKRFEIPYMCPSEDHDFPVSDMEPLTPISKLFPEVKTPQCLHITPGMMGSPNRTNDDKYVFQLQKRMKKNQFNVCKNAPSTKSFTPTPSAKRAMRRCGNTENDSFVVWEMFPGNEGAQLESEEEEDFYFSDND